MRNSITLICILTLLLPGVVNAQGSIKGKLISKFDGKAVPFAHVYIKIGDKTIGSATDIDGRYTLKPLKSGYYDVLTSSVEYKNTRIKDVRVSNDKITFLDIKVDINTLGTVVIVDYVWEKKLIDPENTGKMDYLPADFERTPGAKDIIGTIASLGAGTYQKDGDEDQPVYFKGARADASQYIVDGVKTRNGTLGIPSCAIGEISIYSGGVPAKYGDFTGGVVIIETKSYFDYYNKNVREESAEVKL